MKLIKHAKNIHELKLEGTQAKIAMMSDLHWDNPKCDWKQLKQDLDYCKIRINQIKCKYKIQNKDQETIIKEKKQKIYYLHKFVLSIIFLCNV